MAHTIDVAEHKRITNFVDCPSMTVHLNSQAQKKANEK
jgi:hypothetical protein